MTILPPHGELTEYSLRLHESEFYNNETGRRATLPEMLNLLDNATEIFIPASFDLVCVIVPIYGYSYQIPGILYLTIILRTLLLGQSVLYEIF